MGAKWSCLETKTVRRTEGGARMGERASGARVTAPFERDAMYDALPTERRYVELGVTEFEGASKLRARFDLCHVALGVALDRPFRVTGLTLVCEVTLVCGFTETLDWVETPTGADGTAMRVYGDAVPALLLDTGDARLHLEGGHTRTHPIVFALTVPFGGAQTMMCPGSPADADTSCHRRFSVRAAAKERAHPHAPTRMRLVVELLVGETGASTSVPRGVRSSFCLFRAPVEPGSIEVDVLLDIHGSSMLRSLTAAVPRQLGVARIALTLNGHELVGAPGVAAALAANNSGNNLSHKLLHIPLAFQLHNESDGTLALRITLKRPQPSTHSAAQTPVPEYVHVKATILG